MQYHNLHYIPLQLIAFVFIFVSNGFSQSRSGWNLVWSDEFDGAIVDTTKWSFDIGTGAPELAGWGNNEQQHYTRRTENAFVESGTLNLVAKRESYGNSDFTSARLKTKEKGDWTYGRFEIRAMLPKGQGIWPAIWMLPTHNFYGGWAASGEIDIMELLGQEPSKVYGTLHHGGEWPDNQHSGDSYTLQNGDFSSDFHIFVLEWDSTGFRWYLDSTLYQTQNFGAPFDKKFHLILNVAVGGDWPGPPDTTTVFPAVMQIDYVRVYQEGSMGVSKPIRFQRDKTPTHPMSFFDLLGRKNIFFPNLYIPIHIQEGSPGR